MCRWGDAGSASQVLQQLYFTLDLLSWLEKVNDSFIACPGPISEPAESHDLLLPAHVAGGARAQRVGQGGGRSWARRWGLWPSPSSEAAGCRPCFRPVFFKLRRGTQRRRPLTDSVSSPSLSRCTWAGRLASWHTCNAIAKCSLGTDYTCIWVLDGYLVPIHPRIDFPLWQSSDLHRELSGLTSLSFLSQSALYICVSVALTGRWQVSGALIDKE